MNPQSRPTPAAPLRSAAASEDVRRVDRLRAAPAEEVGADLPSLAHILAHYRRHGTVAGSLASTAVSPVPPAATGAVRPVALALESLDPPDRLRGRDNDLTLFKQFFARRPQR